MTEKEYEKSRSYAALRVFMKLFFSGGTVKDPFLVIRRHMFQYGGVLPGTPVQTFVGSNPPVVLENFNSGIRHPHIDLIFDILPYLTVEANKNAWNP